MTRKPTDEMHVQEAMAYYGLAVERADAGDLIGALQAGEAAVARFRALANDLPDMRQMLATSLNNMSLDLAALNRHGEALTAAEESVAIWRVLLADQPELRARLATSLSNLNNRRARAGQIADAIREGEEAVGIYAQLNRGGNFGYEAPYALSLAALATTFGLAGRNFDAARTAAIALRVTADGLTSQPQALGPLACALTSVHIQQSRAAGIEPDTSTLALLVDTIGAVCPSLVDAVLSSMPIELAWGMQHQRVQTQH